MQEIQEAPSVSQYEVCNAEACRAFKVIDTYGTDHMYSPSINIPWISITDPHRPGQMLWVFSALLLNYPAPGKFRVGAGMETGKLVDWLRSHSLPAYVHIVYICLRYLKYLHKYVG